MKIVIRLFCIFIFVLQHSILHAGFALSGNRVIYSEADKEQSLILANINDYPIVAQTWVDDGAGYPDQSTAPFIVIPAVFKMNSKGIQALRIMYNGSTIPKDRESVFWLNLYEVPGKNQQQVTQAQESNVQINLAMNTQLKVFYRPKSLKYMDVDEILKKVKFLIKEVEGKNTLILDNSTPYHLSIIDLSLKQNNKIIEIKDKENLMISPFENRHYEVVSEINLNLGYQVDLTLIDDKGYFFNHSFINK
jgi:P pilus assembly chaperone PapD